MDNITEERGEEIIQLFLKNNLLDYWIENGEMVYTLKEKYKDVSFEDLHLKEL